MGDPQRTKAAILVAAERLISEKGFPALTLEEVAARASVSKGGLLHHFTSKAALVNGLTDRMIALHEQDIERYRQQDPAAPGAYTRAYIRVTLACADKCSQVCAAMSAEAKNFPGIVERFHAYSEKCDARLAADGLEPTVAFVVRYAAEGLMSAASSGMPRPANYDAVTKHLLTLAGGGPVPRTKKAKQKQ